MLNVPSFILTVERNVNPPFKVGGYLFDMRIIITESKFKSMVTKMVGYDLSHRIEMITSWENLTGTEKHNVFGDRRDVFNYYQNNYGPMFIFSNFKGHNYLVQNQKGQLWFIADTSNGREIDYYDFLQMLNLDMTGISLRKIIDEFAEE
jgi:hypothetical protein